MKTFRRRDSLRIAAWLAAAFALEHATPGAVRAAVPSGGGDGSENGWAVSGASNFRAIYQDPHLRAAFYLFLKNVYNIYPEDKFHELIVDAVREGRSDRDIYQLAQGRLHSIDPFLSDVRYAIPALARQKTELSRETLALLGSRPAINGYMEIGTTGRYVGKLKSMTDISGDLVLVNVTEPSYSPLDIVERGQLTKIGRYVALNDYEPISAASVPDASLDVVANFIGFHHSPPSKRDAFIRSVVRVIRPGGCLILRDHDVDSDEMNHMVALAHDVFNMGLVVPWETNQREIRNFTSVAGMVTYLDGFGLRLAAGKKPLLQPGDPTHNALMEFVKV